ncbi:MAG: DUF423 domain-containing protein [Pseudochelatococcus sp.]|uniref:DUF423 domain-containing protein n=1 Tax=Pseudochelatococcus sp. TaxID=2020869 RepID=UPI003D8F3A7E
MDRALIALGALFGLLGTAAAAVAAHVTGPGTGLDTAANFLLFHAPVLIAVPLLIRAGLAQAALARGGGWLVFAGVALFSGELALRAVEGRTLFYMAAPTGGTLLMAGWLVLAIGALAARPLAARRDA